MNFEIFSFFSGLGFLDLGFEKAGFKIAFVNEFEEEFLNAYRYARRHYSEYPKYGYSNLDITNLLNDRIWKHNLSGFNKDRKKKIIGFIGGPPCQDFSVSGKNEGANGKRGVLTKVYVQLIIKRKPDFFVLENVKGLYKTKKHKLFYDTLKKKLEVAGYNLFDSVENALEYGVPQDRERLLLIGFRKRKFNKISHFNLNKHKKYKKEIIFQALWAEEDNFKENGMSECPKDIIADLTVEHWFQKNDVYNHANGTDCFNIRSKNRFYTVKEGDTKRKSFKRLHRWRFSPTAAYGNNEVHLHPYKPRRLSVAEALAIQSLPKEFTLSPEISL
ncbi:MAG: DNA cytosine methyltransferase, partial [Endomicrobia bacterium]|nr:DNA cytosine methyltransferase [Endomicrobiia bacterium]